MRRPMIALVLSVASLPALAQTRPASPPPPASQTAPVSADAAADACPDGNRATLRLSKLKPEGSLAGFRAAMADHARWYADHGYSADRFGYGQPMEFDRAAGRTLPVKGKYVTFHWHTSKVPAERRDAAWDAYVAKYAANSTVEETLVVCMAP